MDTEQNAESVCIVKVAEPPGYWREHTCGKKAKWLVTDLDGSEFPACGVHKRTSEKRGFKVRLIDGKDRP